MRTASVRGRCGTSETMNCAAEVNTLIEKVLVTFEAKKTRGETFVQWTRRHSVKELQEFFSA